MAGKKSEETDNAALAVVLALGAVVWVIIQLIWWIMAAGVVVLAGLSIQAIVRTQSHRREVHSAYRAAMVVRADQQNTWALDGDERGIYGHPDAAPIEPPRPWSTGRLTSVIGAVVAVALTGASLLVHHSPL